MDWTTQENFARHDEVSDEKIAKDLQDTENEIARIKWLRDHRFEVTGGLKDLGHTLVLGRVDTEIGNRTVFCDCLRELQRLRAERAQSTESIARSSGETPVLKLGSKMVEVPMRRTLESDLQEDR